jgi:glycosyltransferase involved in cell wall biosynthesis
MTPAMKCLHIVQCTNLGGMERADAKLQRDLHDRYGVAFDVVSPRVPGAGAPLFDGMGGAPRYFNYRGKFNVLGHAPFADYVDQASRAADAIWITGTCVSSLRAARRAKRPTVLSHHFHHGADLVSRMRWRAFYELLCHDLKAIVYPNAFTRDEALSIAPWVESKARIVAYSFEINNPKDLRRDAARQEARRRLHIPSNAFVIGNFGWLIERKRFDVFLDVAALVARRIPEAYFVICGGGPKEAALRRQAVKLGIADKVRFDGWVSDLSEYWKALDVLLFNTDFDAFARTPLEAAGFGIPVVASSRYGGLAEFFAGDERGLFFDDHDRPAMAEGIFRLFQSPELRDRVTANAVKRLKARHGADEKSQQMYEILFG